MSKDTMPEVSRAVEDAPRPIQGCGTGRNGNGLHDDVPDLAVPAHGLDTPVVIVKQLESLMLTTPEAAAYLRRSVGWLLHRGDIPYLKGKPNMYRRADLDRWRDEHLTTQDF